MSKPKGVRTGRPPRSGAYESVPNRERILDAARGEFAAKGFRATTLRSVATLAGVDVALIAHYFGNKEGLFAATLELPPGAAASLTDALTGPRDTQAERLTRAYLRLWEDEATGSQLRALTRSTFSDDRALHSAKGALLGALGDPGMAGLLDGRRTGFSLALAHLMGVAIQRHLLPGSPASVLDFDVLVARLTPAIALHLATPDA